MDIVETLSQGRVVQTATLAGDNLNFVKFQSKMVLCYGGNLGIVIPCACLPSRLTKFIMHLAYHLRLIAFK